MLLAICVFEAPEREDFDREFEPAQKKCFQLVIEFINNDQRVEGVLFLDQSFQEIIHILETMTAAYDSQSWRAAGLAFRASFKWLSI